MGFPANGRKPMTVHTNRTTISFSQPFKLRDVDDIQPAGDYLLDTDEELIEGLSRLAYRRVAASLHLSSTSRPQSGTELVSVNAPCTESAMRPESRDALLAAIARPGGGKLAVALATQRTCVFGVVYCSVDERAWRPRHHSVPSKASRLTDNRQDAALQAGHSTTLSS